MTKALEIAQVPNFLDANTTALVVNANSYKIGSSFTANTTGVYHTGTVNAASYSIGSSFIANTTGAYHTGTVNAASVTSTSNTINFGTAFYINSIGDVGIGVSSPTTKLTIGRVSSGEEGGQIDFCRSSDNASAWAIDVYGSTSTPSLRIVDNIAAAARVIVDSSGSILMGLTSSTIGGDGGKLLIDNGSGLGLLANRTGDGNIVRWYRSSSQVGSINLTAGATAYVTSSDYRLKEDINPMTGALAKVAALKPVTYKWKVDGSDGQGFIAHELAEVVPQCVSGKKDALKEDGSIDPQGIDTSFLVATLTAAIQEQQAIITQLQADVAELKSK